MLNPLRLPPALAFTWLALAAHGESIALARLDLGTIEQRYGSPVANLSVDRSPMTIARQTFSSGVLKAGDTERKVDLDLRGVSTLIMRVNDAGDGITADHADWADARIEYTGAKPQTVNAPIHAAVILTPRPGPQPRINGPSVFGVRPGNPFLYSIPATGSRPMTFSADSLPAGLKLDAATGRISGTLADKGEHAITLHAKNAEGAAQKRFRIVVGEEIALTPPLGWNSYNCWGAEVDAEKVMRSARGLIASGLDQHGWSYVNIDDTWQGERGGPFHAIQPDPQRFADMKKLCDDLHAMGLKAGIYSTPWTVSYAKRLGGTSRNAEGKWDETADLKAAKNNHTYPYDVGPFRFISSDAKQWAEWGFDYLKYDWGPVDVANTREMGEALRATGRDIIYSLSNNAAGNVFKIVRELAPLANAWRTTNDISDSWRSMSSIGFSQEKWAKAQRPGHYNDPDMLIVGQIGWGHPHPTKLTFDEQYTHISLWCLLGAPLLIGSDVEKLDDFTLGLLSNDEVLEVDQDPLCRQGTPVASANSLDVYAKPLADGSLAVGLFNRSADDATVIADWSDLHLMGAQRVRDLWRQQDLGIFKGSFAAPVAPHGVVLLRLYPE